MRLRSAMLLSALVLSSPLSAATGLEPAARALPVAERLLPPDNLRLPPASAVRTASGLRYIVLQSGKGGRQPLPTDTVEIDYIGWDFQGRAFDSSLSRGAPSKFPLTGLIKGWQEGVPLMRAGDTFRFWIPGKLAYDGLPGGDTPKGNLVFDVTLHAVVQEP
ncbi:MAG: FKBP-type peptidyl-prolyl cis-trans isomerase [Arenimonas sp.]|nr:FKBP-type peptidyl-prolyl cis-trans isomerase [Arenimonas sp.]